MTTTGDVLDPVTSWAKAEETNDAALDRLLAGDFFGVGPLQQPLAGPPSSS